MPHQFEDNTMDMKSCLMETFILKIMVITKLPNFEQSYKGKVKAHKYINRQNQSTTGKLKTVMTLTYIVNVANLFSFSMLIDLSNFVSE